MRTRQFLPVIGRAGCLTIATVLVACGGSGGDGGNNSGGGGTDTSIPDDGSFFDAREGLSFADSLGSSVAALVGGTFSSLNLDSSSGVQPRSLLQARTDTQTLPCEQGMASVTSDVDGTANTGTFSVAFDDCINGDTTLTGSMNASLTSSDNGDGAIQVSFQNFGATGPEGTSSMNGDASITVTTDPDTGVVTANLLGSSIALVSPEDAVTFSNFNVTATTDDATGVQTLAASATIDTASEGSVLMEINPPLTSQGGNYPESGTMTMTHLDDGSSLTMNADTGNPDTFDYTITDAQGESFSDTGNWGDDLDVDDVLL